MISKFINAINPIDMFNATQMKKLQAHYKNEGLLKTASAMFENYFQGGKTAFGPDTPATTSYEYAKRARIGTALGIGGYALSQTLFENTAIDSVADFVAGAGLHSGITAALFSKNKKYGLGYGAWAGLNMLRKGDNFGPF